MVSLVAYALQLLLVECTNEPCSESEIVSNGIQVDLSEEESSGYWWLLDPARLVIFTLSLVLITHASQRAVRLDFEYKDNIEKEGIHNLTWYHVVFFPVFGSVVLLIFFYFFEYIQYFYTFLCTVVSIIAMYNLLHPPVDHLLVYCNDRLRFSPGDKLSPVMVQAVTGVFSVVMAILWVLTGHWVCLDVLGAALCVLMIQFVRVPSLKISLLLLGGLLVYDVFWVYYSSAIFKANVMVEVAVKRAKNPVAMVAHKLNLPDVVKSRPPLSIPGKLLVPSIIGGKTFAMLGLGDIVLPGLLLCFAMRFDTLRQSNGHTLPTDHSQGYTKCVLCFQKWSYFAVSLLGYATGLLIASAVADISGNPQPALLYLVPCVVLPLIGKAILQGDFRLMWSGPFSTEKTHKGYQQVARYAILPR